MKRPILIAALFYMGGILLAEFLHPPLPLLFGISIAVAAAALLCERTRPFFLGLVMALAGWVNQTCQTTALSPFDLRTIIKDRTEIIRVHGRLCQSPAQRIFERDGQELWNSSAFVEVDRLLRDGQWQQASGTVVVHTPGILPSPFFVRQSVEITGLLRPPPSALADGLFDYREHLRRKGVFYQLKTESTNDWSLAAETGGTFPLSERFIEWARKTLALGMPAEDQAQRLIWTLVLDWKAPMTDSVETPFVQAGTFHIFAVDGLRIGIISGILLGLFRLLQMPRTASGLLVIPILWAYADLTGFPASAIRAAVMMSVVIFGWALKRPSDLINSLFVAALIILLWDPQQLFQAGFQLSFIVVFCIALLLPPLVNITHRILFGKDPLLPEELRPRWRRRLEEWLRFPLEILLLSFAAWLGSIPLNACYFHLFNPISTPANVPVVPLTMLAFISCLGSLLTGWWFPGLAEIFNHASWFLMKAIIWISHWCAARPAAAWNVSSPSPITSAAYYAALLMVGTGWIFRARHKRLWTGCLAGGAVLWAAHFWAEISTTRLHVLPLNGGHAILVDEPGLAHDLLFNCGNSNSAFSVTKPFLQAQGVNQINHFCFSAAYNSEMGGADVILTNFAIGRVYTSPARGRSKNYRRVIAQVDRNPAARKQIQDGDCVGNWSVLHPSADDHFPNAADSAIVLRGAIRGLTVLLLSDLGREGQAVLAQRHPDLRADVVIAALPVKDEPLCDALLEQIQPKLIVIADSEFPARRRASPQLRERMARRKTPVLYCRESGAATFIFTQAGCKIETMSRNDAGDKSASPLLLTK